jgi:transcriptional regulator with XRE-family HTH domain
MRERLIKFMEAESLSSAKFADDIGIQRSTVSHILSGRNNPSFDFIQKILNKYRYLNAEWLILGIGDMNKQKMQENLFENDNVRAENIEIKGNSFESGKSLDDSNAKFSKKNITHETLEKNTTLNIIEKIVCFYTDKTFEIFYPSLK